MPENRKEYRHDNRLGSGVKKFLIAGGLLAMGIAVTVTVGFGLRFHNQAQAVKEIERIGGAVAFESNFPDWLRNHLGLALSLKLDFTKRARGLELSETRINAALLERIAKMDDVEIIALYGTNVTDSDLAYMKTLPNLDRLVLQKTAVSDQGLQHLKSLENLRLLLLTDTQVTDAGVDELKKMLPKLIVVR